MDEAVDQVMGRSQDEKGADKAVGLRRAQQKERARLQSEISAEQKTIASLNEERAPIAADVRKVEAEVGPIKYIAALIYSNSTDQNILEKAVRFVIIMIVLVFDPLALALILAANKQFEWVRQGRGGWDHGDSKDSPVDGPLANQQLDEMQLFQTELDRKRAVARALDQHTDLPAGAQEFTQTVESKSNRPWFEKYPYLTRPFVHFTNLKPMPSGQNKDSVVDIEHDDNEGEDSPAVKAAKTIWKANNPDKTLKEERRKFLRGEIDQLPWMQLMTDHELGPSSATGFGTAFPANPVKGYVFVKVDIMPNRVYKYNGSDWISIDKNISDQYTYNVAYIDYLIEKIDQGQYDTELLTEREQEQIADRIKQFKV
jgi:hypothetical protein